MAYVPIMALTSWRSFMLVMGMFVLFLGGVGTRTKKELNKNEGFSTIGAWLNQVGVGGEPSLIHTASL